MNKLILFSWSCSTWFIILSFLGMYGLAKIERNNECKTVQSNFMKNYMRNELYDSYEYWYCAMITFVTFLSG